MLAKFPAAERIVQVRIFDREGNVVEVEGPITAAEARVIARRAMGLSETPDSLDDSSEPRGSGAPGEVSLSEPPGSGGS